MHYLITIRMEAILDIIPVAVDPLSISGSDLHEHQHHPEQVQHQHHRRHQDQHQHQHQHHQYPNELNRRSNSFWVMVVAAGQGAIFVLLPYVCLRTSTRNGERHTAQWASMMVNVEDIGDFQRHFSPTVTSSRGSGAHEEKKERGCWRAKEVVFVVKGV